MKILVILISLYLILSMHTSSQAEERTFNFCEQNISPSNYFHISSKYIKYFKSQNKDYFSFILNQIDDQTDEVCFLNAFILTDFILYFKQFETYNLKEENIIEMLEFRDSLYLKWVDHKKSLLFHKYRYNDDNTPKTKTIKLLKSISNLLNPTPKKNMAKNFVHNLVNATGPLEMIFKESVKKSLMTEETHLVIKCLYDKTEEFSDQSSLYEDFKNCSNEKKIIEILALFTTQRIWILNDFNSLIPSDLKHDEYIKIFNIVTKASLLYFRFETLASKHGPHILFPTEIADSISSKKPYHFYSVAFIALKMKENKFQNIEIQKYASYLAKKYKHSISAISIPYNILLGASLKSGSLGDKKQIFKEYNIAINYILNTIK